MPGAEEVERAILSAIADAPQTLAGLRQLLPTSVRRPPSEIAALLARLIDGKQVFELGAGTRRAFSARDPAALLDDLVPALLGAEVATPSELKKRVRARQRGLETAVDGWLERQQVAHVLTAGTKRWVVARNPAAMVEAHVREALRRGPLDEKALIKAIRAQQPAFVSLVPSALGAAVAARRLYAQAVYSTSGGRTSRYGLTPLGPDLSALARGPANTLRRLALKVGVPPTELVAAIAAQLGAPAAATALSAGNLVSRSVDSDVGADDLERVRGAFRRMVEQSPAGDVLSLPALRRTVSLDKPRFDAAVLELAERDEVALHLHDLPAALPFAEREALVVHPDGTHFIGIAPRRRPPHVAS